MNIKGRYINITNYVMMMIPIIITLIDLPISNLTYYSVLAFGIIMNSQIRRYIIKEHFIILSILLEIGTIVYIYYLFGGVCYLILFSTLIDIYMKLSNESKYLSFITAIALIYCLYSLDSFLWQIVIIIFFIVFNLFLMEVKRELNMRVNTETLYDELRRKNYELEAARSRILEYSRQVEHIAQLEERNRISRELHDTIGHNLTGVLLQIDAALNIMEVDQDKAKELLNNVYKNMNSSIETVRKTVQKIRPKTYKSREVNLKQLINDFKKNTGLEINFEICGNVYPLLPSIEITIYRNIQEALTNAVRHGYAKNIKIQISYSIGELVVLVIDDGIGVDKIKKGFGLNGMEERMELVGGSINFSSEKGFIIKMSIPIKGDF
jgi:signal transduction histidine kinase